MVSFTGCLEFMVSCYADGLRRSLAQTLEVCMKVLMRVYIPQDISTQDSHEHEKLMNPEQEHDGLQVMSMTKRLDFTGLQSSMDIPCLLGSPRHPS